VGRGDKVVFWEDILFGQCSLAITFWDLYVNPNEQQCTIASVWDGTDLKIILEELSPHICITVGLILLT
jgi:hypothetical protein